MKPEHAKKEMADNPSREDVHEQREANQKREGVVRKSGSDKGEKNENGRPPAQSLVDEQRADWEGMGGTQPPPKK